MLDKLGSIRVRNTASAPALADGCRTAGVFLSAGECNLKNFSDLYPGGLDPLALIYLWGVIRLNK